MTAAIVLGSMGVTALWVLVSVAVLTYYAVRFIQENPMWNPFRRPPAEPEPAPDFTSEAARAYHEGSGWGR